MAAPESKTLQSLGGKWTLNKDLSDDFSPVLALQGTNTMIRKAVGVASVHLKVTHDTPDIIHMENTATAAGIPGTKEDYQLDYQWRTSQDPFFGEVEGRSRWITQADAKANGAEGEWLEGDSDGKLIQAVGKKPDDAWIATHLWGFENVEGARRHTRRVKVTSRDGEEVKVRMVYDFDGE